MTTSIVMLLWQTDGEFKRIKLGTGQRLLEAPRRKQTLPSPLTP